MASPFGAPMETSAEIEILQSRMILSKVIDALNLVIEAEPDYFPIFGRFIAQHRADLPAPAPAWLGLDLFAWCGEHIEVSRLTVPVDLVGQDLWLLAEDHGKFRLVGPDGKLLVNGSVGTVATAGQTQIFVRQLDARAGTRFHLQRNSLSDVLKNLSDRLTIAEQGKQSGVIGIDFQDYSADRAAEVIRHIEDGYHRQTVERRSET